MKTFEDPQVEEVISSKIQEETEINTGAIARGAMDDTYPSQQFLELLHNYGVPICINSDAHTTDGLDCAFDRAAALAKKTGYTELVYPENIIVKL